MPAERESMHLTLREERLQERRFDLDRRAWQLLDLIVAEWQSDPTSTQCFDSRIVREACEIVAERKKNAGIFSPFDGD